MKAPRKIRKVFKSKPVIEGAGVHLKRQIIRGLQGLDLRGMDLVEVAPAYDHAELTALAAATLALEILHVHAFSAGIEKRNKRTRAV